MRGYEHALTFVRDGQLVGLGSGRAASAFVRALGRRVSQGLRIRGVPTSEATRRLAEREGIPLSGLDAGPRLDLAVDGADEVAPGGDLVKGYGGALLREKVVAAAADRFVVLVGPEKLVPKLGARGRLPLEVLPFARAGVAARLTALGCPAELRCAGGRPVVTDNGNWLLDCAVDGIPAPSALDAALRAVPGVLETGLFLGLADTIVIDHGDRVELRHPGATSAPDGRRGETGAGGS